MVKLEVADNSLYITNGLTKLNVISTSIVGLDSVRLYNEVPTVMFYNNNVGVNEGFFEAPLSNLVDKDNIAFTKDSFLLFYGENFGVASYNSKKTPIPINVDRIYANDIDIVNSDNNGFSGSVTDYFDDLQTVNKDSSLNNPKIIKIWFNGSQQLSTFGLGCNSVSGNFSNVVLRLFGSNEVVREVFDDSLNNTKYNSLTIDVNPTKANGLIVEFHTADEVCLSNLVVWKSNNVNARVQGVKDDKTLGDLSITNKGNAKVSIQEYGDTPSIDAFDRLRVSNPYTLYDSKQLHDKQPLFWDENIGGSATSVHFSVDACTRMAVTANASDYVIRQTKQRFNYQPGKALKFGEPILTPKGWINIEKLKKGDEVYDGCGEITKVIATKKWKDRICYRLTFDDGTHVDADENHDWNTIIRQNSEKGNIRIVSTKQMIEEYGNYPPSYARWKIPASPFLEIKSKPITVDAYTLGLILGDGYIDKRTGFVQFTTADKEILDDIICEGISTGIKYHYGLKGLGKYMKKLNLIGKTFLDKFVPKEYLFNDENIRLSVLKGLMDSDGTVDKRDGTTEFNTGSKQLANDISFLVRSIGGQAKIKRRTTKYLNNDYEYVKCADSYRVRIISPICPFKLERKKLYWKPRTRIGFDRFVHSIEPIGNHNTRCIQVDSKKHTFLTRNHVVTHNSQLIFCTYQGIQKLGLIKRVGLFDGTGVNYLTPNNGIFFETDGVLSLNICKNGVTTEKIIQENWNVDKLDGTGVSGITLDPSSAQILVIDFEWLGVGRVRVGWVIDGIIIYAHYFNHANNPSFPTVYMSTPNLPIRYSIQTDGTNGDTFDHICSTVISEGGVEETGVLTSVDNGIVHINADASGVTYALLGIRLKTAYKDITVTPISVSTLTLTNDNYLWSLRLNPTIAGAFIFVDVANSSTQLAIGVTENTVIGGTVISSGYVSKGSSDNANLKTALRMGADIAGVTDRLILCVTPLTSNADILGSLTFRESL